jgi:hypothetical protein
MFEVTITTLTMYASMSLLFLSLTVICGVACMKNFGQGLTRYLANEVGEGDGDVDGEESLGNNHQDMVMRKQMYARLTLD